MQPGVVKGAVYEFHAARALLGKAPGVNSPSTTSAFDTSGSGNHGTLTGFDFTEYGAATNLFQRSRLVAPDFSYYCQHVGTYHGTPVWTRVAESDGSYYEQCVYTLATGDASGHSFTACYLGTTDFGAFAPGDPLSFAIEYQLAVSNARSCTQGRVSICNQAYANWSDTVFTPQATWTRCEENIASMDAGTTGCLWFISVDFLDTMVAGDTITFKWRRPIARKATTAGPYFSGESEGCSWSGTPDESVSTHADGWIVSGWDGTGTLADPHRLVFDGTDVVALPDIGASEDKTFTFEAWASRAAGGWNLLVSEWGTGAATLALSDVYPYIIVWPDGMGAPGAVQGTTALANDELHHLCGVGDGSLLRLYVDGVDEGTPVAYSAPTITSTFLGEATSLAFHGSIALARIYPFALTPTQVAQNFAAGYFWEDYVTRTPLPMQRPPITIEAAGILSLAKRRKDYCHIFVDFDPQQWVSASREDMSPGIQLDSYGKLRFACAQGSVMASNSYTEIWYHLNSGLSTEQDIYGISFDWRSLGTMTWLVYETSEPIEGASWAQLGTDGGSTHSSPESVNYNCSAGMRGLAIRVRYTTGKTLTVDEWVEMSNLRVRGQSGDITVGVALEGVLVVSGLATSYQSDSVA